MESEITHIQSPYFSKNTFQTQIDIIKKASEEADKKIQYYNAHDEDILYAIQIVEDYLKKTHRICYGGQAINAYLPSKYKFYDPQYTIPDYDVFTPTQYNDIIMIVNNLKKAGFSEVFVRQGMHVGTIKIYVNFIAVADITALDPYIYRLLSKRSTRVDGISYLDSNTLRMLMYLELSRPRGEVSRWEKIFERLMLFNEFVPTQVCPNYKLQPLHKPNLTEQQVHYIVNFIIDNQCIFAGADLVPFYESALKDHRANINWLLHSNKPILFYSSNTIEDAKKILSELNVSRTTVQKTFTIKYYKSTNMDMRPSCAVISQGKSPVLYIIHQHECHSYFNVPINKKEYGKILKIASMDTLITLYFSFGFIKNAHFEAIECLANQLVNLSMKARKQHDKFIFPFISIKCSGHQTTMPSLIRKRIKHGTTTRKNLKRILNIATGVIGVTIRNKTRR